MEFSAASPPYSLQYQQAVQCRSIDCWGGTSAVTRRLASVNAATLGRVCRNKA
jgi:hypothetical protein